ncbi:arsenate reductase ArsC [Nitratifractor sp.]
MKKVLVLCTGNSCRSILAEALINQAFGKKGVVAFSAGSRPSGRVNPNAAKVLQERNAWDEAYHSKEIKEINDLGPFDLVVTVCDNAREACPVFPGAKKQIHIGFEDPDGKPYNAFIETAREIEEKLLPVVEEELLGEYSGD